MANRESSRQDAVTSAASDAYIAAWQAERDAEDAEREAGQ